MEAVGRAGGSRLFGKQEPIKLGSFRIRQFPQNNNLIIMTGYIRQIDDVYYLCKNKTTKNNICELNSKAISLIEKNIWKLNQKIEYDILEYDSFFGDDDNAFKIVESSIIITDPIYNSKIAIDK